MTPTDRAPRIPAPFLVLWTGQAASLAGSQAVQFALIWWLTARTGSATVLATASLVGLVPAVALGPVIGALVDRWNRKTVMLVADAAVAAVSAALALAFLLDVARVEHVFLALFVRAVGSAFHGPAMLAATSLMVPREQLARVQGLNQSLQGALLIFTAPLGALFQAWLPLSGVMLVDVVTALFAIVPLAILRVPEPPPGPAAVGAPAPTLVAEIVAGFRYLGRRRGHLAIVGLGAGANLFLVPAFSLLPLLILERLHGTAADLGLCQSAFGLGCVLGGIALGVWGGFARRMITSLAALLGLGGAVLAVGLTPVAFVPAAWIAMLAVGFAVPLVNGPIQAVLQATVAPEFQGRVFTLLGSLAAVTAPLGLLLAAPVAELAGVRVWYLAGATACLVLGLAGLASPAIMRIEEEAV